MTTAIGLVGAAVVLAGLTAACVSNEARGTPLYPESGQPRARGEVALLTGPIKAVDGKPVAGGGSSFELLPGCHVVEIGGRVGSMDPSQGGWTATVPQLFYAFQMEAGGTYSIAFELGASAGQGPIGSGRIAARATSATGSVSEIEPAKDTAALQACNGNGSGTTASWATPVEP